MTHTTPTLAPLSRSTFTVTKCGNPKCGSTDIRGPFDTPERKGSFVVIRAWFCRPCQWYHEIQLLDDLAKLGADLARKPSTMGGRR